MRDNSRGEGFGRRLKERNDAIRYSTSGNTAIYIYHSLNIYAAAQSPIGLKSSQFLKFCILYTPEHMVYSPPHMLDVLQINCGACLCLAITGKSLAPAARNT